MKEFLNPAGISTPTGYTHVVTALGGKLVFIAGQTAFNAQGQLVGQGDLRAQAKQVYEHLKTALASVGASFADVVKMTTFVVNYKPEDRAIIAEMRNEYLPKQNPPASTLLGVQSLAREGMLIEIEATAVL